MATSAFTLQEAVEMLQLWKDCERSLASGTAKAYRVGTREYTAFDLDEVGRRIEFFKNMVDGLSRTVRSSRAAVAVPRDK